MIKPLQFSDHAINRIKTRLGGLVTVPEIQKAITGRLPKNTKEKRGIIIKRIPYTEIPDSSVIPDGIARGDEIIAIVLDSTVLTVCLRKSACRTDLYKIR
jgi:hypothetical protein